MANQRSVDFTQDNTRQNKINLVRQDKMLDSTLEIG